MRITSATLRDAFINSLQQGQQRLLQTQTQISTGSKVNRPSDDPLAAARIQELEASLSRIDQYQSNALLAQNRLGLEEEALVGVVNGLQRIRELAVQANNATSSQESRRAISVELRQQLSNLLALANSADGQGRYLFAGFHEETQPFNQTPTGVVYSGDDGRQGVSISDHRVIFTGDPGSDVFQRIRDGNGTYSLAASSTNTGTGILGAGTVVDPAAFVADDYTITFLTAADYEVRDGGGGLVTTGTYSNPQSIGFLGIEIALDGDPAASDSFTVQASVNKDVFAMVADLIAAVETSVSSGADRAKMQTEIGQGLADMDQAIGHLLDVRGDLGARLRAVESEIGLNDGFGLQLTTTLSGIRDLDYAEAISTLTQQLQGIDATQQTYARLQGLTLFRFL